MDRLAAEREVTKLTTDMDAREEKACSWCKKPVPPFEGVRHRNHAWCDDGCREADNDFSASQW